MKKNKMDSCFFGVGWEYSQLHPRSERLPQDRRHRVLHAQRQRGRTNCPHQRRRMGYSLCTPWLECSRLNKKDAVFVFSVGGGSKEKDISVNLIYALDHAINVGARILGITGRNGGYTGEVADACLVIPTQSPDTITPHAEAWQAVVWHMLVTDPRIMAMSNKWESLEKK